MLKKLLQWCSENIDVDGVIDAIMKMVIKVYFSQVFQLNKN